MNIELKPCPFCGGEAEMVGDQYPYVECQECAVSFLSDHSYEFDFEDAASKWNARSDAGPRLKPIAESKVRQLGGDVCGVLVRKDGKTASVDEHGRVQWLQSGQGVEPVAEVWPSHHFVRQNHVNWLVDVDDLPNDALLYLSPQPAEQQPTPDVARLVGKVRMLIATGNRLNAEAQECTYDDGAAEVASVDFWGEFRDALEAATEALAAHSHNGEQGGEWIKCSERLPTEVYEDSEGQVWLCWPHRDLVERVARRTASFCEGFWWMPTGLKRPQPPKEGEGDE